MNEQTRENLEAALHGEGFAYARYKLFAARAREEGDDPLAQMFDGIAEAELQEHFAELADLAGLVGSSADNVVAAIASENEEVEEIYPAFAAQASAAGALGVAERFEEIRDDELEHVHCLEAALERLQLPA
jgi:rubrerythrin